MLSELQVKNIGAIFDALDTTKDGEISRDDFTTIARAIADSTQQPPSSPQRRALFDSAFAWWNQISILADVNLDGRVTREEYLAAVDRGLLTDPNCLDAVSVWADAVFDAADRDGDGLLARDEMAGIYIVVGQTTDVASGAFEQIDTNGDGMISGDEFRAAVRGAFTSVGPEDVGSRMIGQV